jgi:protein SCO1
MVTASQRCGEGEWEKPMNRLRLALFTAVIFAAGFSVALIAIGRRQETTSTGIALIGGPFSLTGAGGKIVTDRDFRGKLMLVLFGYTNCPDVCPTELQTVAQALDKLGPDADKIAPIFISIDPERDKPDALSAYVKAFSPRITGLSGTPEQVAAAAKAYRVYYQKANADRGPDYTMDHSVFIYLMDGNGKYLTHFTFESSPSDIAEVLRKHAHEDKSASMSVDSTFG